LSWVNLRSSVTWMIKAIELLPGSSMGLKHPLGTHDVMA
jgi:hypothetical protein